MAVTGGSTMFDVDSFFVFLDELHTLVVSQIGALGIRRCTEVRATAGRRNTVVSFEVIGRPSPLRLGLYWRVTHDLDQFRLFDWFSIADDALVWSTLDAAPGVTWTDCDERIY